MSARETHHLYVHVPFCRLVCAYCDFVTVGGRAADIPRYISALVAELAGRASGGTLTTVYFGGGTPSLLPAAAIARVLDAAREWTPTTALEEVTVEANPSAREVPDWQALRAAGVDRISLGIQSLRDAQLRTLARGHSAEEGRKAYADARQADFAHVSVDLIYGIPDQSLDDWRADLTAALALAPDHLSLYGLQLVLAPDEWAAPPRSGALRWRERLAPRQDDALAVDQYRLAEDLLDGAGYRHYELSSWALPGHESRHNAAYWDRRPYTGIGAGAHSFDGAVRSWNARDLDAYLAAVEAGRSPREGEESLDEATQAFEAMALGLRRVDGVDRQAFAHEFGMDPVDRFAESVEQARGAGLLEVDATHLLLTPDGRLLANEVLIGFLAERVDSGPARLVPS